MAYAIIGLLYIGLGFLLARRRVKRGPMYYLRYSIYTVFWPVLAYAEVKIK